MDKTGGVTLRGQQVAMKPRKQMADRPLEDFPAHSNRHGGVSSAREDLVGVAARVVELAGVTFARRSCTAR